MAGEIVPGERLEIMDMGKFGSTPRFFIALQSLSQFSPLRGHIAQFKEGGTQITRMVSQPMSGNRFLQVRVGSAKITSFHRQSGTKQALAQQHQPAAQQRPAERTDPSPAAWRTTDARGIIIEPIGGPTPGPAGAARR